MEVTWGPIQRWVVLVVVNFPCLVVLILSRGPGSFVHTDSFVALEPIFREAEEENSIADDGEPFVAVWVVCVWRTGTLECFPEEGGVVESVLDECFDGFDGGDFGAEGGHDGG